MTPASLLAPSTPSGPRYQPRPAKLPASCAAMTGAAVALTAPLKWHSPPGMASISPSFERNLSSPSATVSPPVHGPWPLSARPSLTCQHCTVPVRPCSTLACTQSPRHQPPAAYLPPCCAGSQPRRVLFIVGPPSCPYCFCDERPLLYRPVPFCLVARQYPRWASLNASQAPLRTPAWTYSPPAAHRGV